LKQVVDEQEKIGSDIELSKHLLRSYNIRDLTDKLLLVLALIFYFSVCVYIIFARVNAPLSSLMNFFGWVISFFISSDIDGDSSTCTAGMNCQ
jgi:hypothetical protein